MEVAMVSLLPTNGVKTKMDVSVQNSSTFFYVFLGAHKFCGNKYVQLDQTFNEAWMLNSLKLC